MTCHFILIDTPRTGFAPVVFLLARKLLLVRGARETERQTMKLPVAPAGFYAASGTLLVLMIVLIVALAL